MNASFKIGCRLAPRDGFSPASGAWSSRLPALIAGLILLAALSVMLALPDATFAQPVAEWRAVLGGDADEFAHAVALADDGGYVIAGETRSFGSGSLDGWLVKLDATGKQEWARSYGGALNDVFYDVQRTTDGGYILAGETHSADGASAFQSDFWLIKTNAQGTVQWERSFGNTESALPSTTEHTSDVANAVRQTRQGDYIVAGTSSSSSGSSVWVLRTSSTGRLLWSRNPGVESGASAFDVEETPEGEFAIAGRATSSNRGSEALLIKTDSNGNTQWTKTFGEQLNDEARSLVLTSDGGFALGGFSWSHGAGLSDYWLLKADADGTLVWQESFGGIARDSAHSLIQTSDGGFALAGWSESFSSGERFWLIKTDSLGKLQWSRAYPQTTASEDSTEVTDSAGARAIRQTEDLGFVIAGWVGPIQGARDILVVKTAPIQQWPEASDGAVARLENTGTVSITTASAGFTLSDPGSTVGPLRFWYNGRIVDRDNPLPPGRIACTQPTPELDSGARLTLDQVGSYDSVYLNSLSGEDGTPYLGVDRGSAAFRFTNANAFISGNFAVAEKSPCHQSNRQRPEGPAAPTGISAALSEMEPGAVTLDWDDSTESEVAGYGVYFSRNKYGPYELVEWLLPGSSYTDSRKGDGSTYNYSVSSINVWGLESSISETVSVQSLDVTPPDPPSGLRVVSQDREAGRATLEWNANFDDEIKGYRLYRQDEDSLKVPITALLFGSRFEDWTLPSEGVYSYSVTAIDVAGNESTHSNIAPPALDFFGRVLEVQPRFTGGGNLIVDTDRGSVEVNVTQSTEINVPNRGEADLEDLHIGDSIAIALQQDGSAARQIYLVPSTTKNRHFTGLVLEVDERRVVIQPSLEELERIVLPLTESVKVTLHRGVAGLVAGSFVIVSYTQGQGDSALIVSEINIVPSPDTQEPDGEGEGADDSDNVAVVRGVFQGINRQNANIILSSIEIGLHSNTVMEEGLSVGEAVFAEAFLLTDGSLLARKVGQDEGAGEVAARTTLRGQYEGRNISTGQWIVSGTPVTVDRRTNAESLPLQEQRVKVTAILRGDGSLYARDIQNLLPLEDSEADKEVRIEGVFLGIASEGTWDVGGIPVNVNADTELSGRPSLGQRVAVTATVSDGALLASKVSGAQSDPGQPERTVTIRGVVGSHEEGSSIVVDGIAVTLSELTKTLVEIEVGSSVIVKADIDAAGTLTAREVSEASPDGQTGETRASPVDIEGRIERLREGGGLLVNGIPVNVTSLTEIHASLQVGAPVQVRGLLQRGGAVLARQIFGYGPGITSGTEASIEGVASNIETGSEGRVSGFVIDGIPIAVDSLTRLETTPTNGVAVSVQAIVVGGEILAVTVEPQPLGIVGVVPRVQMQGVVQNMPSGPVPLPLDITVNGVTVRISADTTIIGSLSSRAVVRITGRISDDVFLAQEIERIIPVEPVREEMPTTFRIQGILQETSLDSEGRPDRLLVSGERIIVEALSEFVDEVFVGNSVTVEGVIREGILVATTISLTPNDEASDGTSEEQ